MNNFGACGAFIYRYNRKHYCLVVGDYAHIIPFCCDENFRDDERHRPLRENHYLYIPRSIYESTVFLSNLP